MYYSEYVQEGHRSCRYGDGGTAVVKTVPTSTQRRRPPFMALRVVLNSHECLWTLSRISTDAEYVLAPCRFQMGAVVIRRQ